jgi:putative membrane protein insertion efficiency factor
MQRYRNSVIQALSKRYPYESGPSIEPLLHCPRKHAIFAKCGVNICGPRVPGLEPCTDDHHQPTVNNSVHHSPESSHCPDCATTLQRLPRNAGRALIWIYRHTLSPLVGYNCRHLPTCSVYGDEAIERFGLWGGGWMTLARILRCQPWGTSGIDNVPQTKPPGACWYLPWRYGRWRGVNG